MSESLRVNSDGRFEAGRFVRILALLLPSLACGQGIDRLLVGSMTVPDYASVTKLPLPIFPNEKFCTLVSLGPSTLVWAYVPTSAERVGDFRAFAGQLIDPLENTPFPGGIIPASRLPDPFAWRLAPTGPAPGEPCLDPTAANARPPQFSTTAYITGRSQQDTLSVDLSSITLVYNVGKDLPSATLTVSAQGDSPLEFAITKNGPVSELGVVGDVSWLSAQPTPCCTTPSKVAVTVAPGNLFQGVLSATLQLTAVNTISTPLTVPVNLAIILPPTWVGVDTRTVQLATLSGDQFTTQDIHLTSSGPATNFAIKATVVSPPGVDWFTVSPQAGSFPATVTLALNQTVIDAMVQNAGAGNFSGYIDIVAPGAPNSPLRIVVLLKLQGDPGFTMFPANGLTFTYSPDDPTPAPQPVDLDPVETFGSKTVTFSPSVTMTDASEPVWIQTTSDPNPIVLKIGANAKLNLALVPSVISQFAPGTTHTAKVNVNAVDSDVSSGVPSIGGSVPVALVIAQPATPANITQVLPHIADGNGWKTKIVLVNTDLVNDAPFTLRFWPGKDTPVTAIPVLESGPLQDFTLSDVIPHGGSRTYSTQGAASLPLWQGWGELNAPPSVGGTAVFRQFTGSGQDTEGAVPLKLIDGTRFVLPFDCTSPDPTRQFGTSVAIINTGNQPASIAVTAHTEDGNPIDLPPDQAVLGLGTRGHDAFKLTDPFPVLGGKRGTVEFTATAGQIAGLGLRFSSKDAFTSLQTLTGASAGTTKRIAHIVDGEGWKTTITIVNMDAVPTGVTITFHRGGRTPTATLALEGPGLTGSIYTTSVPIQPNGSLTIATQGTSSTRWEGWAEIRATANIAGLAIFRQEVSDSIDSEGAVPFSTPGGTRFLIPFDITGGFITSLAVVSPDANPATITAKFRDTEGNPVNSSLPSIALTGHTAFELGGYFGLSSGTGVADFSTNGTELFAIGLLFNSNTFTSLPVLRR